MMQGGERPDVGGRVILDLLRLDVGGVDVVPLALGLAAGLAAGLLPPRLTGWADPMLVPGAIAAMSAASVMYRRRRRHALPRARRNTTTAAARPGSF